MARYITLLKFTAQGVANIKDTTKRAENAARLAESLGGRLVDIMWTQGAYDAVVTTEFSDDETQTAFIVATVMQGNVTTQTMRAFTAQEVQSILAKIP